MAKRIKLDPQPLTEPRSVDPFSGAALSFVQLSNGRWQVRGKGWSSTTLYQSREQAEWDFSFNFGVRPAFKSPYPDIQVRELEPPDTAPADLADRAIKAGEKLGEELAKELADGPKG